MNCRETKYYKQNEENKELFKDSKTILSRNYKQETRQEMNEEKVQKQLLMVVGGKLKIFKKRFGSKWEEVFFDNFKAKYPNAFILRRGCPDFFIQHGDKTFFVEVKGRGDKLSSYQKKFKEMLNKVGIKVYISKNGELPKEYL